MCHLPGEGLSLSALGDPAGQPLGGALGVFGSLTSTLGSFTVNLILNVLPGREPRSSSGAGNRALPGRGTGFPVPLLRALITERKGSGSAEDSLPTATTVSRSNNYAGHRDDSLRNLYRALQGPNRAGREWF
jgi:hypothetical protein